MIYGHQTTETLHASQVAQKSIFRKEEVGNTKLLAPSGALIDIQTCDSYTSPYLIIVADAADAVSVNFSGRCKFLLI